MANYIIVGDPHIKYTAPTFRKETYFQELKDKINQINIIAKENNAKVLCLGDFFNSYVEDYFELIVYELADMIYGWQSLIGNHDCKSIDGNLKGTSFGALVQMDIIKIPNCGSFDYFHYYNRQQFTGKSINKVAFIHDYIIPAGTKENFEYKECFKNDYNIVFCGHYHYPFDVVVDGTHYVNPGSLMRSTVKELELNRTPEVILFNSDTLEIKHMSLKVKPLTEVANTLEENKLDKTFESKFANMLLETDISGDNNDIINLLKKKNIEPSIISYIENKLEEVK